MFASKGTWNTIVGCSTSGAIGIGGWLLPFGFSGLMLPLIGRSIPDMTQTFNDFAVGLKTYALPMQVAVCLLSM